MTDGEHELQVIAEELRQNPQMLAEIVQISMEMHSGPLPSPKVMEEYERTLPGAAADIMGMAKQQMNHRHALETKAIEGKEGRANRAPAFGIAALFLVCLTGVSFAYLHYAPAGISVVFGGLVTIVIAIITGRASTKRQAKQRDKILKDGMPPKDVPRGQDLLPFDRTE